MAEEYLNREQPVLPASGSAGLWKLNLRRIRFMILGIALTILIHLASSLSPSTNIAGGLITWSPEIAITLFCGVISGPLTGLVVGGAGSLIEDLISYHMSFWNWELGYALIGFLAGLSILLTSRRASRVQTILIMELVSLLAVIIGIGLASWSDIWVLGIDLHDAAGELLFTGTSALANGSLLLLLFLAGYYSVRSIRERLTHRK